jgi:hypothetical protein
MKSFFGYIWKFTWKIGASLWGAACFISTFLTFFPAFRTYPLVHRLASYSACGFFIISVYNATWKLHQEDENKITALKTQLEEAKRKPFNEEQRHRLKEKTEPLTPKGRDLLRLLLQRGPMDQHEIRRVEVRQGNSNPETGSLLNTLAAAGLLSFDNQVSQLVSHPRTIWQVILPADEILKESLFPRDETVAPQFNF